MTRDGILALSEEELGNIVEFDFFKRSGNGGQKRNKTSSAVRVILKDFNISATTRRTLGEDISGACGQLRRSKMIDN